MRTSESMKRKFWIRKKYYQNQEDYQQLESVSMFPRWHEENSSQEKSQEVNDPK